MEIYSYLLKCVCDSHISYTFQKLDKHKYGNSIYFTHDNMVCFQNPVTYIDLWDVIYIAIYCEL